MIMGVPKFDREKFVLACKDVNKKNGQGSIFTLDSKCSALNIPKWSTGIEQLDDILEGGIPYGRTIEIFGAESHGKTSLAYWLCAQHEAAYYIPIEGTLDAQRAKMFGNKKGQLFVNRAANTGEKCLEAILKVAPSHIPCIVIDSVPCMVTEDQLDPKNITKEGRRGTIASLFSLRYPAVRLAIEENGNTVILINQIRDKMNAMPFGEQTTTPGGHAIKHFNSIQLKVSRVKWIEVPNKDPRNDATNEKIGMIMNIKVTKSKVSVPLKECKIAMLFHYGFMTIEQAIEKRKEIMAENNQKYRNK